MNIQFIAHIDVTVLAASVLHKDRAKLWDKERIYLRGPVGLTPERLLLDEPSENYKALDDWGAAKNVLTRIHKIVSPRLRVRGHVWIEELLPGHGSLWDSKTSDYDKAHMRFIVPLITHPGVFMACGPQWAHAEAGSLISFNHRAFHTTVNFGDHRSISLVVDYRSEDQ